MARIGYAGGRLAFSDDSLAPRSHPSECVASLDYDEDSGTATCEFMERGTYEYYNMEPEVFGEWNTAGSRGTYFNLYVRGRYNYGRIG